MKSGAILPLPFQTITTTWIDGKRMVRGWQVNAQKERPPHPEAETLCRAVLVALGGCTSFNAHAAVWIACV
jgi:hypothetical protein